jgi:hypothetical protein
MLFVAYSLTANSKPTTPIPFVNFVVTVINQSSSLTTVIGIGN